MRIKRYQISGISMIELVIFILIMSIAFIGLMSVFNKTQRFSADSMIKIKTVELTQALMEEILLKSYDENTPVGGGCVDNMPDTLCLPASQPNASVAFGTDGEAARTLFDDVDDYHNLAYCGTGGTADASCGACVDLIDEQGNNIADEYPGFGVCIQVNFDGGGINADAGIAVRNNDAKRIDIIISDPSGSDLTFSSYRVNF